MEGIIKVKKRNMIVPGGVCWGILQFTPPDPLLCMPLSFATVAFFLAGIVIYFHNQNILANTNTMRVISPDGVNWWAHIRTDRIHNPDYRCVYRVYFTISKDELEKVQEGNVTTYTGDKVRVQEEGVRNVELFCDWIGKNGEEIDGNIWRNKFATCLKRNYRGRISVLCCGYIRQERI